MSKIGQETDIAHFEREQFGSKQGKIYMVATVCGCGQVLLRREHKDADLYWLVLDYQSDREKSDFIHGYLPFNTVTLNWAMTTFQQSEQLQKMMFELMNVPAGAGINDHDEFKSMIRSMVKS